MSKFIRLDPLRFVEYAGHNPAQWRELINMPVEHNTFGEGRIQNVSFDPLEGPTLTVEFATAGRKVLGSLSGMTALLVSEEISQQVISYRPPPPPPKQSLHPAVLPAVSTTIRPDLLPIGNVYWLSMDTREGDFRYNNGTRAPNYTDYAEIKRRKVLAQGMPEMGSIQPLLKYSLNKEVFRQEFVKFADSKYLPGSWWHTLDLEEKRDKALSFYNLCNIRRGDLVVAREGRQPMGICQVQKHAIDTYVFVEYHPVEVRNYRHTFCSPVDWYDWDIVTGGNKEIHVPPIMFGVKEIGTSRKEVIQLWQRFCRVKKP